tara:strand:+ start:3100 stop:3555 length:456 start_codon:yes stop_codon:yes gene_type:complete
MKQNPFGFEAAEDSPGYLLWQTTQTWQRLLRKVLEPYGISHAQFVILATLLWHQKSSEEVTQNDLVHLTRLDKMTVSKSLGKLVSQGYLERYENFRDNRAKTVLLTDNGKALTSEIVPLIEGMDALFFGSLIPEDQQKLIKILQALVRKKS